MSDCQGLLAKQADRGSGRDIQTAYLLALRDVAEATAAPIEMDRIELTVWFGEDHPQVWGMVDTAHPKPAQPLICRP